MDSLFKEVAYEKLLANAAYEGKWFNATFFPFYNDIFATKDDVHRMIEYVSTVNHTLFVSKIFSLIEKADLCDEFIDFAIENESKVGEYYDKTSRAYCSVDRDSVRYVLTNVTTYDAVKKMWLFLPAYAEHRHGYGHVTEELEVDGLRHKLFETTSTLIARHPDLENVVDQAWRKEYKDNHILFYKYGYNVFSAYRKFMANNGKLSIDDFVDELLSQIGENADLTIPLAGIYLRVTVQDINRLAEEWEADDDNKCIAIANLRHTPLADVNAAVKSWIKNKFTKVIMPYDDALSAEEIERRNISEFLKYERFKKVIESLSKDIDGEDMAGALKRAKVMGCNNNYIYEYLHYFYSCKSNIFDVELLKGSLDDNFFYYYHVVRMFGENTEITFTDEQKQVLKTAVETLLRDKRTDRVLLVKSLNLIRIQGFKFDFELIGQFINQAGNTYDHEIITSRYSFLDYAMNIYGFDKVGAAVEKILNGSWEDIDKNSLFVLIDFASRLNIRSCYQSVCEKIIQMEKETSYVCHIMRYDSEGVLPYLKANFDDYNLSTEIHIARMACEIGMNNKRWAERKLLKLKDSKCNQAQFILLSLGNEDALNWCVEMAEKDVEKLCEYSNVPSLAYEGIKYLPQLLRLLKAVWKFHENSFHKWPKVVQDALGNMAEKNIEQHDVVVSELENLRDSYKNFASLNFFIHSIKTNHNPRTKSEGFTVKGAYEFIVSNP